MLKLENVTLRYGNDTVIENLSYQFTEGKTYGIIGASGIGKTTLLSLISSLIKPTDGKITNTHKDISVIFQDARLYPWLTALDNVKLVYNNDSKARALLSALTIKEDDLQKYPDELSGGMRQRVAIARALNYNADLFLLDEPFKGLDSEMRTDVRNTVFKQLNGKTVIIVTHDKDDLPYCDVILKLCDSPVKELKTEESGILETE